MSHDPCLPVDPTLRDHAAHPAGAEHPAPRVHHFFRRRHATGAIHHAAASTTCVRHGPPLATALLGSKAAIAAASFVGGAGTGALAVWRGGGHGPVPAGAAGLHAPGGAVAVPEPGSLAIVLVAAAALILFRLRSGRPR